MKQLNNLEAFALRINAGRFDKFGINFDYSADADQNTTYTYRPANGCRSNVPSHSEIPELVKAINSALVGQNHTAPDVIDDSVSVTVTYSIFEINFKFMFNGVLKILVRDNQWAAVNTLIKQWTVTASIFNTVQDGNEVDAVSVAIAETYHKCAQHCPSTWWPTLFCM